MYVLNEKRLITDILKDYKKPDELSLGYLIVLLAKYYVGSYNIFNNFVEKVKEEVAKFNIENYQEYQYAKKIEDTCEEIIQNETKRCFKEIEYIPIYQSDMDIINALPSDKYKKLMFTIIANARYMNSDGWINKRDSDAIREVFKQANINGGSDLRAEMLHWLYINGYIKFAKANMNQNIQILNFEHYGDIVYKITSFQHLGNQYLGNFKKGYKNCECCGKKIRITNNRVKYCKKCAEEMNRKKTTERMQTIRNN